MVGELSEPSKGRVKGQGTIILAFAILFSITMVVVHIVEPEMNCGALRYGRAFHCWCRACDSRRV